MRGTSWGVVDEAKLISDGDEILGGYLSVISHFRRNVLGFDLGGLVQSTKRKPEIEQIEPLEPAAAVGQSFVTSPDKAPKKCQILGDKR